MPVERPDHYATLGVSTMATPQQITRAYRALVRALHPDTASTPGDTLARFTAVTTAYRVLHDTARRAAYDRSRRTPPQTGTAVHVTIVPPPAAAAAPTAAPAHRAAREPALRVGPTRIRPLP